MSTIRQPGQRGTVRARLGILFLALALLTSTVPALTSASTVHTVCPDGSCDHVSIQTAIDNASPGDAIVVGAGVYEEALLVTTDDLTIQAATGVAREDVVIDPPATALYAIQVGTASTTVQGFTLEGVTVQNPDMEVTDQTHAVKQDPSLVLLFADDAVLRDVVLTQGGKLLENGETRWYTIGVNIADGSNDALVEDSLITDLPASTGPATDCTSDACATVGITKWGSGTGLTVRNTEISVAGGGCNVDGCYAPSQSYGILLQASYTGVELVDNTISASLGTDAKVGGTDGIRGALPGALIEGNTVTGWAGVGAVVSGGDLTVRANTFEDSLAGLMVCTSTAGSLVEGNTFAVDDVGFLVTDCSSATDGLVLRENTFSTARTAVQFRPSMSGYTLDARLNHWGVEEDALLGERVEDLGTDNVVLQVPFLTSDGQAEPGLVRIAGQSELYWTVEDALAAATTGDTVLVPASLDRVTPAVRASAITVADQDLTLCSSVSGAHACADDLVAAHWQLSKSEWTDAPGAELGQAILFDLVANTGRATSLFPADGTQVEDLISHSFDAYVESGAACDAGSPRIALGLDVDGDGTRDAGENVLLYNEALMSSGCPTDQWTHVTFEEGADTYWFYDARYDDLASLQAALPANHSVAAVNLQWDNGAANPGLVYVDNLQHGRALLGEPADIDCYLTADATCRWTDAPARTVLDGTGLAEATIDVQATGVTVRGLTVANGATASGAAAVTLGADDATVVDNIVRITDGGCGANGCYAVEGVGIQAPAAVSGATIVGNDVRADLPEDDVGATKGIEGQLDQGVVRDNVVTGFAGSGALVYGDGLKVDQNTFRLNGDGLLTCSGSFGVTAEVTRNEFLANQNAIAITGCGAGTGVVLNDNQLGPTNEVALWLKDSTALLDLNAECNEWGVYHGLLIEQRILDEGTENQVDYSPFTGITDGGSECLLPPTADYGFSPEEPTRLDTVQFTDRSTQGRTPIVSHEWSFGDGATSDEQHPTHQFEDVQTFDVRLRVKDLEGMVSTSIQSLTVDNLAPTVQSIQDLERLHNQNVIVSVDASDQENDPLTYTLETAPAGMGIDAGGVVTWDPAPDQGGVHGVTVGVDDGYDKVTTSFNVTVINNAPVIDPLGTQATHEELPLSFDVLATDVDGDAISLTATDLPANATFVSDGAAGTFAWTPSVGEAGSYNVTFTATSAGPLTDTVTVPINVGQYNTPPTLSLDVGATFEARPGELVEVTAQAADTDNATSELSWDVVAAPEVTGASWSLTADDTAVWTWEANPNHADEVLVTFEVSDGINTVQLTTLLDVLQPPAGTVYTPEDVVAGTFSDKQFVDSSVTLRGFARDADGTVVNVTFYPEGLGGPSVQATSPAPRFYTAPYTYTQTGTHQLVMEVSDDDGLVSRDTRAIQVVANTAPVVDPGSDVLVEADSDDGALVNLSGAATDPDGRGIDAGSFTWTLPNGQTLSGKDVTHTFPVGTHTVTLNVADVHGGIGEDTLTVVVDDYITATASLPGASRQTEDGVYVLDKTQAYASGQLVGELEVLDDQGLGVAGANFVGIVKYYGSQENPEGLVVGRVNGSTDANGSAAFAHDHELLNIAGEEGILSAPGYHEVQLYVGATSRADAPADGEVLEVTGLVVRYWVGPAPVGSL